MKHHKDIRIEPNEEDV